MSEGKVSPGDDFSPPPAVIWNNMVDAGREWSDSQLDNSAPNPIRPRETDIVKVKNTSGTARRLGEILRISGKAIETVTDENKWLLGVEPTDDGYFGILKEPAAISGIASLQVSGCCMALVDITDASHTRATSAAGDYVLQSGDDGPIEILFAPDGTGEKTCVVRFAGGGGGGNSRWGLVVAGLGCGWYTIELGTLDGQAEASGSGAVCDPCVGVTGEGTADCELTLQYPAPRVVGIGVYVLAYDPASTLIPLKEGTDCVLTRMPGGSAPASGSGSGSTAAGLWAVRGFQEHIVQYKNRAECCDDGTYKIVGKTPVILIGRECEEILCEECPASGSGSG